MSLSYDEREFLLEDPADPLRAIRGRLSYPAGAENAARPRPCVLALHGFKGFMDWGFWPAFTRHLVGQGFGVVRFNFSGSGHGAEPERFSEERAFFENTPSRELDDLERVRTWLDHGAVPWLDPRRAALVGHSLGGGVALVHAARRHDYRAVVGWAAVSTFRRFPPEVEALWRRQGYVEIPNLRTREVHRLGLAWLEDIERNALVLDLHAACARLETPTLLVHGEEDEAVALSEARSLEAAFAPGRARLAVLPRANHTFHTVHPPGPASPSLEHVFALTSEFLRTHLA